MLPFLLAGASVLSNSVQNNVNRDTANTQMGQIQNNFNKSKELMDTSIGSYDPYGQAGLRALQSYQDLLGGKSSGDFANNPAFAYQQQLLNQRLAKTRQSTSASAQGVYSQPLISNEYQATLNRLMPLISGGMSAAGAQASLRGGLANMYADLGKSQANATAAGMPRYDTMVGNAIGSFMGASNMESQGNYMNALAQYYTKGGGKKINLGIPNQNDPTTWDVGYGSAG